MTGARLLWNLDLRMHETGHWVAVGVLAGMEWQEPMGEFSMHNFGGYAVVASGPTPNEARANCQALARLKSIRMGAA